MESSVADINVTVDISPCLPNIEHGKTAPKVVEGKVKKVKNGKIEKKKKNPETKTVIFVPQTENSILAKMLRQEEATESSTLRGQARTWHLRSQ